MNFVGGVFSFEPDESGELGHWWRFEDLELPLTRLEAAAGSTATPSRWFPSLTKACAKAAGTAMLSLGKTWTPTGSKSRCASHRRSCASAANGSEAKDKELGDLCVKAYNDWMVDEWCEPSGGRLLPLIIIQLWDAELAAAEVYRNAARGVRNVCFSEIPAYLGLPSIHTDYWEPFFRACAETKMTIQMHIGSSSKMPSTSADAPAAVGSTLTFGNAMSSMTDWRRGGSRSSQPSSCRIPRAKSAGSPTSWNGPTRFGE